MKLPSDLRAFVESLNFAGVKYVVVGGYAVSYHGRPRFTGDIDFFIEASVENGTRVVRALDHFGFGSIDVKAEDFAHPDQIFQFGFPPNRIDIITHIDDVTFDEAWGARITDTLDGLDVAYISKEHLLRNKRATNRPKDQGDLDAL